MKYIPNSPDVEGSRNRSGTRTPMHWDASANAGFSTAPANKIYIPIDPDKTRPTLAAQDKKQDSQLNYVRELLRMRAGSSGLGSDGSWKLLSDTTQSYPMIYLRSSGNEKYVVAINPTNKALKAKVHSKMQKKD